MFLQTGSGYFYFFFSFCQKSSFPKIAALQFLGTGCRWSLDGSHGTASVESVFSGCPRSALKNEGKEPQTWGAFRCLEYRGGVPSCPVLPRSTERQDVVPLRAFPLCKLLGTTTSLSVPCGNKQRCLTTDWVAKHEMFCLSVKKHEIKADEWTRVSGGGCASQARAARCWVAEGLCCDSQ